MIHRGPLYLKLYLFSTLLTTNDIYLYSYFVPLQLYYYMKLTCHATVHLKMGTFPEYIFLLCTINLFCSINFVELCTAHMMSQNAIQCIHIIFYTYRICFYILQLDTLLHEIVTCVQKYPIAPKEPLYPIFTEGLDPS